MSEDAQKKAPRRRRESPALRREQIIEAAQGAFAELGYAGASTKDIARRSGLTEGLLYHYFPSKAELLRAVVTRKSSFVGDAMATLERAAKRPIGEVILELGLGLSGQLRSEKALVGVLLGEAQTNLELYQLHGAMIDGVVARLAAELERRVATGELRAGLAATAAAHGFFGGLMLFFIGHWRLDDAAWRERSGAYVRAWVDSWLHGLYQPAVAAPRSTRKTTPKRSVK